MTTTARSASSTRPRRTPTTDFLFSPDAGTYTYPTARKYANNAADLVEFRDQAASPTATAFRVTLNSLTDPSLVGFTIALGSSVDARKTGRSART